MAITVNNLAVSVVADHHSNVSASQQLLEYDRSACD